MKILHRTLFARSLFIVLIFALGCACGLSYRSIGQKMKIKAHHKRYRIARNTHPVLENKSFVILIMSYNNGPWIEKNLLSVLEQDYDNYRIIYINDASTDGSEKKIKQFIELYDFKKRITLIENSQNKGAMYNMYHNVHACRNEEIIVTVDGDDFLAHPHVLSTLNAYYANPDVWLTYGNYVNYPMRIYQDKWVKSGCSPLDLTIVNQQGVRAHAFVTSHPRTFYAGLFKRIRKEDLLDEGNFVSTCCDVACMLPMVELAGEHAYFVSDILYCYNRENPISDFRKDRMGQLKTEQKIKALPPYMPLSEHPKEEPTQTNLGSACTSA